MAIVGVGSLALAVGFAAVAFTTWRDGSALTERGVTTTASVLVSDYAPDGTSSITVGFKDVAGTSQRGSIDVANSPPPQGTTVTIRYDPQHPSTLRLAGADAEQNMGAGGWAAVAALFGIISVAALVLRRVLQKHPVDLGGPAGAKR